MKETEKHKNNCLICGKEIVYLADPIQAECFYCTQSHGTNATCTDGHFVCDTCHGLRGKDIIETFTLNSMITDPIAMALILMENKEIKMHGPEHHFLVPAVLLAAFYNKTREADKKAEAISKARQRSDNVLGGFCGFYGDCGAAVGVGIFVSVLTGSTPLSRNEWRLANLSTGKCLITLANHGGPRCCKRNSFLAINEAAEFLRAHFNVSLDGTGHVHCTFSSLNKECLRIDCPFFMA